MTTILTARAVSTESPRRRFGTWAQDIPVTPKTLGNRKFKPGFGDGHHVHPDSEGLCEPDMRHEYLQQKDIVLCLFKYPECEFLR